MSHAAVSFAQVLSRPDVWRGSMQPSVSRAGIASGFAALDAVLPGGGWPTGALTELLCAQNGIGEIALLRPALAALAAADGWIGLIAPPWPPYAPGWAQQGLALERLVVVRADGRDAQWAAEQFVAAGSFAAVLAWLPRADAAGLRRLQVAQSGRHGMAAVFRPLARAGEPSPAPLRIRLRPAGALLELDVLKRRGGPLQQPLRLAVARPLPGMEVSDDGSRLAGPRLSAAPAASLSCL